MSGYCLEFLYHQDLGVYTPRLPAATQETISFYIPSACNLASNFSNYIPCIHFSGLVVTFQEINSDSDSKVISGKFCESRHSKCDLQICKGSTNWCGV